MKLGAVIFALFFYLTFSGQQCHQDPNNQLKIPTALFQRWFNSFEEDHDTIKIYRPDGFDFPLARGRAGFAFLTEGKFEQYNIAPTDGMEKTVGTWQMESNQIVRVQLNNVRVGRQATYWFRVVALDNGLLKIRFL